ncbi:MAG: hypothetical protein GAK31_00936 [Stenotrophomonas maltophilia]|uniref:Phage tail collar domain-containing protein n=1 Tax=Stenotrophomonas maltophilia TaxID=40324 RepID=A0A7V8JNI0_STEMA|nr:MAG: hypothetical protein GAK31_00936 [Stenotrophomonas maltophilia]
MKIQLTAAGLAALVNAQHAGTNSVTVTEIGVTANVFAPDKDGKDVKLPGELKRLKTFGGQVVANDTIHVSVRDDSGDAYSLYGIGLYLADGTLLGLYGQQDVILEKSAKAIALLSADIVLADADAKSISFGSTEFLNPPATTEVVGVIEIATDAETKEGKDASRAVTPASLMALIKDSFSAYRRYLPGQIVPFAGKKPPTGLLACDGKAVSRTDYADLFSAIGTAYGKGDGKSTFNVPLCKEGTTITHTNKPELIGAHTVGEVIAHAHTASASGVADHVHNIEVLAAGGHAHAATCGVAGSHVHGASCDVQGDHSHGVNDPGHSHTWSGPSNSPGADGWEAVSVRGYTAYDTGRSLTGIYLSNAGAHSHNIGIAAGGEHQHEIVIAAAADHTHALKNEGAGAHTHAITVNSEGGSDNLPAGLQMMYCIAY